MKLFLGIGIFGTAVLSFGLTQGTEGFFQAYLAAYLFWVGVPLASMAFLMIHHLTGGAWGHALRPFFLAALKTFPFVSLFFVPLLFGLDALYPWTDAAFIAKHPVVAHKAAYLNAGAFTVRAIFYFLLWNGMAFLLLKWTKEAQNAFESPAKLQGFSGAGLIVYALSLSFAVVDWSMSLAPEWFSTIYPVIFAVGYFLTALALYAALGAAWTKSGRIKFLTNDHFHDFGNLLLAFVMLWAYTSFSQFLIIWSGNLPEEITHYLDRFKGGWKEMGLFLIVFHFATPFFLLLGRTLKTQMQALGKIGIFIAAVHFADMLWQVGPAFHPGQLKLTVFDFAAWIGLGGLWLGAFTLFFDFNHAPAEKLLISSRH